MALVNFLEEGRRLQGVARGPDLSPVPLLAVLNVAAVCLGLLGLAELIAHQVSQGLVFGLMCASPVVLFVWLFAQQIRGGARAAGRIGEVFAILPESTSVAVTLASSGYCGTLAARLVPTEATADFLNLAAIPDPVLLLMLPALIVGTSFIAITPIMSSVFLGSFFGSLPILPADPTLIALAISCGWALSVILAPFATLVLLTAQISGRPAKMITIIWNGRYGLITFALLLPIFAILNAL